MTCYCASHNLYSSPNESASFLLKSSSNPSPTSLISKRNPLKPLFDPLKSQFLPIFQKSFELSSISFSPNIPKIDFLDIQSDPLYFHREFISKNFPCIITNAIHSWEALDSWQDPSHLIKQLAQNQITVDLTPDGFADSIKNQYFIEPYQAQMTMKEFLNLDSTFNDSVGYIQKQNDNLNSEFSSFFDKDINSNLRDYFSNKFFNKPADACNFWMGKNPSVSSLHKDHYENIYAVIQGEKHFTLIPPVCYPCLGEGEYKKADWDYDKEKKQFFVKEGSGDLTRWLTVNPDSEEDQKVYKAIENEDLCKKFHVVVQAGEILYLPSLWFHQVSQYNKNKEAYTMAINFWFDMEFGNNYALLETLKSLVHFS